MNGTTNFILTKMSEEGLSYQDVLKEAQDLGYAEADPTADVEGLDAARKLAILASISFNRRIFFEDVTVEGITCIDTEDIKFGKEFGYNIKLLGIAKETAQGLSLNVYPAFIPTTHPLASVRGILQCNSMLRAMVSMMSCYMVVVQVAYRQVVL